LATERWLVLITKDGNDGKGTGTVKAFFNGMQKAIESNPAFAVYWFDLLTRTWLRYFYPVIYARYHADLKNPLDIGYHPYCPPPVHVSWSALSLTVHRVSAPAASAYEG
jgi:hypothetical protein